VNEVVPRVSLRQGQRDGSEAGGKDATALAVKKRESQVVGHHLETAMDYSILPIACATAPQWEKERVRIFILVQIGF